MLVFSFTLLRAFFLVAGLSFVSYTDLKSRIAPNLITYSLIALGLLLHLIESLATSSFVPFALSASGAVVAFFFSLFLYKVGAWAGGDVKLFTGIGALMPVYSEGPALVSSFCKEYPLFPFTILANSVLLAFPFITAYVFWRT